MGETPTPPPSRHPPRDVEETLRRLDEAGELRDLPGAGVPLPPDPDADAGEEWAARHLLRTASAAPAWVDLRHEIDDRTARLRRRIRAHAVWLDDRRALLRELPADRILEARRATAARDERVRRDLQGQVEELNALIRRYDLQVVPALQLPLVDLDRLTRS